MKTLVYKEDYMGPVWVYGCNYRPAGYASVPDGRIVGGDVPKGPTAPFNFGTIEYDHPLTAEEITSFELTLFRSGSTDTDRDRMVVVFSGVRGYAETSETISVRSMDGDSVMFVFDEFGKYKGVRTISEQ